MERVLRPKRCVCTSPSVHVLTRVSHVAVGPHTAVSDTIPWHFPEQPASSTTLAGWLPPELVSSGGGGGGGSAGHSSGAAPSSALPYTVNGNKKGGIPVAIGKGGKGKPVTIVSNVQGDAEALLTSLKKAVGCGGAVNPGEVVIQGECVHTVEAFLVKAGCLKGVSKQTLAAFGGSDGGTGTSTAAIAEATGAGDRTAAAGAGAAGAGAAGTESGAGAGAELPTLATSDVKKMKPPEMKKLLKAHGECC